MVSVLTIPVLSPGYQRIKCVYSPPIRIAIDGDDRTCCSLHSSFIHPQSCSLIAEMFTSALKSFTSNISANYTISTTPSSVSGAWKVYDGKKKSTGKAVSVFVFERKSLDSSSGGFGGRSGGASLKKLQDEVIARVKRESNLLARLRHPSILELAEPIEDTRSGGLMFATEPVTASLSGLLQEKDHQERAGGVAGRPSRYVVEEADGQRRRRELEIDELEIQKGLLQVAQGLEFLHESAGLVHGNLTPDAIFVNVKVCLYCSPSAGPHPINAQFVYSRTGK